MTFDDFLKEKTQNQGKFYHSYLGIKRKEFPKWSGWKYIDKNKSIGEIKDPYLDDLVRNFYFVQFLQTKRFSSHKKSF